MNIYDRKQQFAVIAEITKRRRAKSRVIEAELREVLPGRPFDDVIVIWMMDIEATGGIVDLTTGDVDWPQ